ncbi:MAG: hypothetical protein WKG32_17405 [Gemmatimonadaceae bacterium]
MGATAAAAVMLRREREVVDAFRRAGATSPATARPFSDLGLDDTRVVKRLRARAVVREATPGRVYLDEEVWVAVRRTRQRLAFILFFLLLVFALGVTFFGSSLH